MVLLACLEQPFTDLIQILMMLNWNQGNDSGPGTELGAFHLILKSVPQFRYSEFLPCIALHSMIYHLPWTIFKWGTWGLRSDAKLNFKLLWSSSVQCLGHRELIHVKQQKIITPIFCWISFVIYQENIMCKPNVWMWVYEDAGALEQFWLQRLRAFGSLWCS